MRFMSTSMRRLAQPGRPAERLRRTKTASLSQPPQAQGTDPQQKVVVFLGS